MAITDRNRKLLWARAHNACAICKCSLIQDATDSDSASIVGDEAHIISASATGPRGGHPCNDHDGYDNLILLCKIHHKIVDDQPLTYTIDRLLEIKRAHEASPHPDGPQASVRLEPDPAFASQPWTLLTSGAEVWRLIHDADCFRAGPLQGYDEAAEAGDDFLDLVRDYVVVADEIAHDGLRAARQVQKVLDDSLDHLAHQGVVAYGTRTRLRLTGGRGAPSTWWEARIALMRFTDLTAVTADANEPL